MILRTLLATLLMLAAVAPARADAAANKALMLEFYARVFNGHDLAAANTLLAPGYIQHNPGVPQGRNGFVRAFRGFFADAPQMTATVKRVIAEGNLVALHVLWRQDAHDRGTAAVDIYRIENGRIAEHWDVEQPVSNKVVDPGSLF